MWFKKRRPYREVTTASLVKWRDELFEDIQDLSRRRYDTPIPSRRRELARITAELDHRSEETL